MGARLCARAGRAAVDTTPCPLLCSAGGKAQTDGAGAPAGRRPKAKSHSGAGGGAGAGATGFVCPIPTPHGQAAIRATAAAVAASDTDRLASVAAKPGKKHSGGADAHAAVAKAQAKAKQPKARAPAGEAAAAAATSATAAHGKAKQRNTRRGAAKTVPGVTALSRDNILARILQLRPAAVPAPAPPLLLPSAADADADADADAAMHPSRQKRRSSAPAMAGLLGDASVPLELVFSSVASPAVAPVAPSVERDAASRPRAPRRNTVCTDQVALNESSKAHELWTQLVVSNISNIPFAMRGGHAHPVAAARALAMGASASAGLGSVYTKASAEKGHLQRRAEDIARLASITPAPGLSPQREADEGQEEQEGEEDWRRAADGFETRPGLAPPPAAAAGHMWSPENREDARFLSPPPGRRSFRRQADRGGRVTSDAEILASVRLALRDSMLQGRSRVPPPKPIAYK